PIQAPAAAHAPAAASQPIAARLGPQSHPAFAAPAPERPAMDRYAAGQGSLGQGSLGPALDHTPVASAPAAAPQQSAPLIAPASLEPAPQRQLQTAQHYAPAPTPAAAPQQMSRTDAANAIQQSIARIHEACQAPPLSPPEYRALFDAMAQEINSNGLTGAQTLVNIGSRAQELGIDVRRDDIRFVLEVVSEADPWFEQGASAVLFSSRFRNFVVARCRSQGLTLSSDELDLIEAWFAGAATSADRRPAAQPAPQATAPRQPIGKPAAIPKQRRSCGSRRSWSRPARRSAAATYGSTRHAPNEKPRILRAGAFYHVGRIS
ncbi:MAG: hypothetical protein ABL908_22040, partial [Hyphomicrobium sp.]